MINRGIERERKLQRSEYFSGQYFSLSQLSSFIHQLNLIRSMNPISAVEIGIGNGFVSTFLRNAGIPMVTADINPALDPDICAPLSRVASQLSQKADLTICCEVLEHMPLDELDDNLDSLAAIGNRLFLTLPNSYRCWGISGFINLPKLGARLFDLNIDIPWRRPVEGSPHFWEVGYNRQCSRKAIENRLRTRYKTVRSGRFALNPYHIYFVCQ